MPTLGHELLPEHRPVVEIRFGRQSPQPAFASFSNLRNELVEQVRGTSGWSYHRNYSPPETANNPNCSIPDKCIGGFAQDHHPHDATC